MDYQTVMEYVLLAVGIVLSLIVFVMVAGLALLVASIVTDIVKVFLGRNKDGK